MRWNLTGESYRWSGLENSYHLGAVDFHFLLIIILFCFVLISIILPWLKHFLFPFNQKKKKIIKRNRVLFSCVLYEKTSSDSRFFVWYRHVIASSTVYPLAISHISFMLVKCSWFPKENNIRSRVQYRKLIDLKVFFFFPLVLSFFPLSLSPPTPSLLHGSNELTVAVCGCSIIKIHMQRQQEEEGEGERLLLLPFFEGENLDDAASAINDYIYIPLYSINGNHQSLYVLPTFHFMNHEFLLSGGILLLFISLSIYMSVCVGINTVYY